MTSTVSPLKPWQKVVPSTTVNPPTLPSSTNKNINNPHINRSPPNTENTTNANDSQNLQIQPQPSYNNYNNGTFGMYNNSMYNQPFGGGYGTGGYGGMYGGGLGGYGMNSGYNMGLGMGMGLPTPMMYMQDSVNKVGRFSQLLQTGSQALHMTFSSLVQFAGNLTMLAREFGGVLSGVYLFKILKWIYNKVKRFLYWIIGRKPTAKELFEISFKEAVEKTVNSNGRQTSKSNKFNILSIGFYSFGILYLLRWIWNTISYELSAQKQLQMQQNQRQSMMHNQQRQMIGGYGNPYQQQMYGQQYGYMPQQQMSLLQSQQMRQMPMQRTDIESVDNKVEIKSKSILEPRVPTAHGVQIETK